MKSFSQLFVISFIFLSFVFLSGCGKDSVPPYIPSDKGGVDAEEIEYGGRDTSYSDSGPTEESLDSAERLAQAGSFAADQNSDEYKKMYGRSSQQMLPIYFDFDQASIRPDQIPRLEQNAEYLQNNSSAKVVIEGNTDERGTNEYNIALAERRALNAKIYLMELGIEDYRIRTVSYGEERPLFMEQDEFSWAQNRRDDFILE
ncbi:MAG: peptidoglycan-associated lipoprotein Pal [Desulfobulbaceae bacterium]|nr:peptidoglycan-associated lipoprotein Pal [Desulfobulbaceae bacterium]